ncbi:HupE/UreJ family protein [Mesorhizobium sp. SB112]|uniref:HupE/UreJ family protein n=1 Tax=Mesorhizobium sp. SB112 TaxID=3151853 RepID=UPI003265815D
MLRKLSLATALLMIGAAPAFAHLDPTEHGSFVAGFTHPIFGLDHILAMVAVGLWASMLGGRAIWLVPTAFVGTMALGFAAALAGLPLPFVEPVILASVVVLGLMVALAAPLPVWPCAALVGFFAFFHGHAHGGEIGSAGIVQYALGFIVATAVLHAIGVGFGHFFGNGVFRYVSRAAGAATALGGVFLALAG